MNNFAIVTPFNLLGVLCIWETAVAQDRPAKQPRAYPLAIHATIFAAIKRSLTSQSLHRPTQRTADQPKHPLQARDTFPGCSSASQQVDSFLQAYLGADCGTVRTRTDLWCDRSHACLLGDVAPPRRRFERNPQRIVSTFK
jgi:hypothetical protein